MKYDESSNTLKITLKNYTSTLNNSSWSANSFTLTYNTKLTSTEASEVAASSDDNFTYTNTVTQIDIYSDLTGEPDKTKEPNEEATVTLTKLNPAPGFVKEAYANFQGQEYTEGDTTLNINGAFGSSITAGDTLIWRLVSYNGDGSDTYTKDNTVIFTLGTITDTLPDNYTFDTTTGYTMMAKIVSLASDGSYDYSDSSNTSVTLTQGTGSTANTIYYTVNGQTVTFDCSNITLSVNIAQVIEYATVAKTDLTGVFTNSAVLALENSYTNSQLVAGESTDEGIWATANYSLSGLSTDSYKTIKYTTSNHTLSSDGHDDPETDTGDSRDFLNNYVQGMQSEDVTYTLNITNNSTWPLQEFVIIDHLPYVDDVGLVSGYERGSAFSVAFKQINSIKITTSDGTTTLSASDYTVTYSTNKTAVLDEYSGDWLGEDDIMTWTSDPTDAVNFRIMIDSSIEILANATITIEFTGTVPVYVAATGEDNIAWNSFAYGYQQIDTFGEDYVMVAEPAKVGVWVEAPTATNSVNITKKLTDEESTDNTFYFALFTKDTNFGEYVRISDVVNVTIGAGEIEAEVTMPNIDYDTLLSSVDSSYSINGGNAVYIYETDINGNLLSTGDSAYEISYEQNTSGTSKTENEIDTSESENEITVTNEKSVGSIKVTKTVTNETGYLTGGTIYFALFTYDSDTDTYTCYEDAGVKSLSFTSGAASGTEGTVTFTNVPTGKTYYVFETTSSGQLTNTNITNGSSWTYTDTEGLTYNVTSTNNGVAVESGNTSSYAITNVEDVTYSITVSKSVSDSSYKGTTFTVGVFTYNETDNSYTQFGDTQTVAAGSSVTFDGDTYNFEAGTAYYVFEVDSSGNPI